MSLIYSFGNLGKCRKNKKISTLKKGERMLLGIQLLGVLFGLLMVYLTFLHHKRREFTVKEGVVWFVMWMGFMFIALFPNALNFLVKDILQLSRPLDFFIICGFMFLIGVSFYSYTIMRSTQNKVEEVVRNFALQESKKKKGR